MSSVEENIKKYLEKTGFPTEIKVDKILSNRKWRIVNQLAFLDKTENKIRSTDFEATFFSPEKNQELKKQCLLHIECKKSEKRYWVFYVDPDTSSIRERFIEFEKNVALGKLRDILILQRSESEQKITGLKKISFHSHDVKSKTAYTYQVAFKGAKESDNLFEAQNQVLKSIFYSSDISLEEYKNTLIFPLIVFDGKMFECSLVKDELKILPIEYIKYLSHGLPEEFLEVFIDIVTLDFLPRYLELLENEIKKYTSEK